MESIRFCSWKGSGCCRPLSRMKTKNATTKARTADSPKQKNVFRTPPRGRIRERHLLQILSAFQTLGCSEGYTYYLALSGIFANLLANLPRCDRVRCVPVIRRTNEVPQLKHSGWRWWKNAIRVFFDGVKKKPNNFDIVTFGSNVVLLAMEGCLSYFVQPFFRFCLERNSLLWLIDQSELLLVWKQNTLWASDENEVIKDLKKNATGRLPLLFPPPQIRQETPKKKEEEGWSHPVRITTTKVHGADGFGIGSHFYRKMVLRQQRQALQTPPTTFFLWPWQKKC